MRVLQDVVREIRLGLSKGQIDLGVVADSIGVSTRSLQRALREEGASFHALVDRERRAIALARIDTARVLDLVCELGYSDRRAFVRAFKRWTGTTPRAFRAALHVSEVDRQVGSSHAKGMSSPRESPRGR